MTTDNRDLQLNALLGVTEAINTNLPEDDLFKIYKFTLLGDLRIKKLALFMKTQGVWENKVHFGGSSDWSTKKLDNRFDDLKQGILIENDEFPDFKRVEPIHHKDRILGLLFLDEVKDVTFVQALTNILIVAVENKRLARKRLEQKAFEKELDIARKVQTFLFPKYLPDSEQLRIVATYQPHHNVGGDYYDYIKLSDSRFIICIADVSGKGVPAALLMSNFQATLNVLARRTENLEEIVHELNKSTVLAGNGEHFITFFIGLYDFKTREFQYINCGHNPLYIIQKKELISMNNGTTVLGMFDPLPFIETDYITNLKEFVFFGFTDGLTETFSESDEQFGEERLEAILKKVKDISSLHNTILQELDAFKGSNAYGDDITMLSCKVVNR